MKLFVTVFLFFISFAGTAQTTTADSARQLIVVDQANKMAQLLLKKDYKGFSAYSYPTITKMMGGTDKMAASLEKVFKEMETSGLSITNVYANNCSAIINTGSQLQCTLDEVIEMKHPQGKLIQKSTLIAISNDKGATWKFIDSHNAPLKELQKTIKELSNKLVIPAKTQPTLLPG